MIANRDELQGKKLMKSMGLASTMLKELFTLSRKNFNVKNPYGFKSSRSDGFIFKAFCINY